MKELVHGVVPALLSLRFLELACDVAGEDAVFTSFRKDIQDGKRPWPDTLSRLLRNSDPTTLPIWRGGASLWAVIHQ